MNRVRVFLGGEGANELGSHAKEINSERERYAGVIEALLQKVCHDGWEVVGGLKWKDIRKLRARGPSPREEQNVRGLAAEARRANAGAVAFIRDADSDAERPKLIDAAIDSARGDFPDVDIIGGSAVRALEAWILAAREHHRTEALSTAKARLLLQEIGIAPKSTEAMVNAISSMSIKRIPSDAVHMRSWLQLAEAVLQRARIKQPTTP